MKTEKILLNVFLVSYIGFIVNDIRSLGIVSHVYIFICLGLLLSILAHQKKWLIISITFLAMHMGLELPHIIHDVFHHHHEHHTSTRLGHLLHIGCDIYFLKKLKLSLNQIFIFLGILITLLLAPIVNMSRHTNNPEIHTTILFGILFCACIHLVNINKKIPTI